LATIEPIAVTPLIEDEIHEAFIQIVDTQSHAIVAVIEILRPSNKTGGSAGRLSYQKQRLEVLLSTSHLVEIDLLRAGVRTYFREQVEPYDYLVHVSTTGPAARQDLANSAKAAAANYSDPAQSGRRRREDRSSGNVEHRLRTWCLSA
jgi:hypothetical protein